MTTSDQPPFLSVVERLESMSPAEREALLPRSATTDELVAAFPELGAVDFEDMTIPGRDADVPCRRYRCTSVPARGAFVWVHGGGFIGGDLDFPEAHWVALGIAARGFPVLSVDYRKCLGGVCFPAPFDDVLTAWRWAGDHAAELGVSPDRVHLGGASAGATLAAGVTKRLRDGDEPMPATLVLAYGMLHPSLPPFSDELRTALDGEETDLTPTMIAQLSANYAGSTETLDDPYAFAGNGDVSNQPPVYLLNSEIDTLRSSAEAYAEQLVAAGVDTTVETEPAARHGHLNEPFGEEGPRSLDRIVRWLEARTP